MSEANGHREHLENRAAEVRARLGKKLSLIDERRHHVAEVARAAVHPPTSIIIVGAVVGVAASLFFIRRSRARRKQSFRLADLLRPAPVREKSFLVQGLQKATMSLVATAVQRIGKRSLDQLLAEPAQEAAPLPAARPLSPLV